MSYKQGQNLVCIHEGKWIDVNDGNVMHGPKYEETVTCAGQCDTYASNIDIAEYLLDNGNPQSFNKKWFIPLSEWNSMEEQIAEALQKELV